MSVAEWMIDSLISDHELISDFTSESDAIDFDSTDSYEESFEPYLIKVEDRSIERAESKGFDLSADIKKYQVRGAINAIVSVTGDDEAITTDCNALNFVHFSAGEIISHIKVSEKDTNVSQMKGNYTEGWILLPPNAEADHTSVIRRHARNGVGLTFDITKLKAASAVRKQSTKELDFESKFKMLHKAADWTDPDWFTYDYAQMGLVLATAIFDYRECRIFPYLFPQEGGCGGFPPWKNIDTAISALEYFNGGNSIESILCIMDEATLIQQGRMGPDKGVYIAASHYAQLGDKMLNKITKASKHLSKLDPDERMKCLEMTKGQEPLPEELVRNSVVICPTDKLLGAAISELRKNGLVMTEMDIRLKQLGDQKTSDLLQNRNMGVVRQERQLERAKIKKNGLAELAKMAKNDAKAPLVRASDYSILKGYYKMRSDISDITGLSYEGQIRLFKTSDVQAYYQKAGLGLVDELLVSLDSYKNFKLNQKLGQAKTDLEYQIEWMKDGELSELFDGEIPPSVGSDDARIGRKILLERELLQPGENLIIGIITNDVDLVTDLRTLLRGTNNVHLVRVPVYDYLRDCKTASKKPARIKTMDIFSNGEINAHTMSKAIVGAIPNWRSKNYFYKIMYDFPNINRSLEGIRKHQGGLFQIEGGFLRRATVKTLKGWTSMEWKDFKKLEDFKRKLRRIKFS